MKKKIATFKNPSIEACIKGLYRFESMQDAVERLNTLADNFELSGKFERKADKLTLWIKGFEVTEEEKEDGYLGNFADLSVEEVDGSFFIIAKKRKTALKFHPQKKRDDSIHPNWGHPILRDIKSGRSYQSPEDAMIELQRLHKQYPKTSIPTGDKLFIIIYEKLEGKKEKTHKYVLSVQKKGSEYIIDHRINKQAEAKDKIKKLRSGSNDKKVKGYYTQKEEARKKK